jgi:tartrate dehydratase beta subunit/fumarate hydratase class I family protein
MENRRSLVKSLLAVLAVIALVGFLMTRPKPETPFTAPAGSVYFTGPMRSKSGTYGNEAGEKVAGPATSQRQNDLSAQLDISDL